MKRRDHLLGIGWIAFCLSGCERPGDLPALDETLLEEVSSVGVVEGREEELFGLVSDVRALEDSTFLVLDAQGATIGWFTAEGEYLGGLRSRGAGPGELQSPSAFAVDAGELLVVDRTNQRLDAFRFDADGFTHSHSVPGSSFNMFNFPGGQALCSVEGRRYIRFLVDDRAVHELDRELEVARSFEAVEPVGDVPFGSLLREVRSRGRLLCLDSPPMIVSMGDEASWVRAFSMDGELLWQTELSGVRPRTITSSEETGIDYAVEPADGSHRGISITRWSEESLLVQYELIREEEGPEGRDYFELESRELSIDGGDELGRTTALPRIAATSGELAYAIEQTPIPRVIVLRRTIAP